jgi:predicted transcriptional regulator
MGRLARYRMRYILVRCDTHAQSETMDQRLYSYLEILQEKSQRLGVTLLDAFKWKDIPSSTYYRTIKGTTELRYETARLVNKAIEELHALRKHREELKEKSRR